LAAVIVLPLTVPVLIFGVLATTGAISEPEPFASPFLILCAISLAALASTPFAAAAALRQALD
jgi:heme exporter protein B